MLQNPFYLFFTACLGLFFWAGYRRIFAEVPYRHSLWSFLGEECAPGQRHAIVRALLAGLPGDSGAMAWILTMAALCLGGAGALFWYLVFSLLWLHPLGALAGLWRYYQPGCGGRVELSALLEGILCRKRARARPGLGRLLRWLQTLALCGMLPLLFRILASPSAPARGAELLPWLVVLLALWLLCRLVGERGETVLSLLFLLLLAAALLGNLPNLIPAVKLVLLDAFDRSRFLFSLSGAGLAAALQAGGAAGCGGALLRTLSAREEGPSFAHPAQAAFYEELRGLLQLTVQLALGLLFLCARLVPEDNRWPQTCLWAFLCLFGLLWLGRAVRALARPEGRRCGLLCLGLVGAAAVWDIWKGTALLPGLSGGAAGLASLALAGLLLFDSNWYFLLLEHYRDVHIWHVTPHPDLMQTEMERKNM